MMDVHATIERLLKMTVANGASIQEAETAAAACRKLLDKHGLTIEEVQARREQKNQGVEFEGLGVPWTLTPVWARSLAVEIASGFDCRAAEGIGRVQFLGFPPEPAVATYLFRVLARELPITADAEGRFLKYSGQELRDWKQSYLCAAALRIGARLRAARQRTSATAALVVCKEEAVSQVFEQMFAGIRSIPVNAISGITNLSGAICGDEAGQRAVLDGRPLPSPRSSQRPLGFLQGGNS